MAINNVLRSILNKKHYITIALFITTLSMAWMLLTPVLFPAVEADASRSAPHQGFYAPLFTLETPQGERHALEDYQGQPVLVFFWASWCSVCKSAMPGLESVYQDFGPQGFTILAVNTTTQDILSSAVNEFASRRYTYTMLLDQDGTVANLYRMRAVPTSVLVGPDGRITDVVIGSGISEGFLRARLSQLLAEGRE
jgi:peroxiredoxin